MKVLIIGQGGREHTIAWKIAKSKQVSNIYVAPGNAGTSTEPKTKNINIKSDDLNQLLQFTLDNKIDLTIVGPEAPLVAGIVDLFQEHNLAILGPNKLASQLEGSKAFCKSILLDANIPTANYKEFNSEQVNQALNYVKSLKPPYVIKADGLAAGKGVCIIHDTQSGINTINQMLNNNLFGAASHKIIIEDYLEGIEASFIALVSNNIIIPLASSQDHKTRDNNDTGPNTGGMGAYSPAPIITAELECDIINTIIKPTIESLSKQNIIYNGFLYAGLMIDKNNKINILEYNCRLGDPETQVILPRLDSDFFDLCYKAAHNNLNIQEASTIKWNQQSAITVVLASRDYPQQPMTNETITISQNFDNNNSKIFHCGTCFDNTNTLKTNGGRVLAITSLADTLQQAQNSAYQNIKNISWPAMFYRTDIGYKAL